MGWGWKSNKHHEPKQRNIHWQWREAGMEVEVQRFVLKSRKRGLHKA